MGPGESEFEDLRLAAKAADRGKAAKQQWPAFEKRLRELGYSSLAIAHAFSTLSGPGSVAEALEVLRAPMPESHPIALTFEVTETRGGSSAANRVTITSVERDDSVIHVNYEIVPPPDVGSHRARAEAKDDLGNDYGTPAAISGSPQTEGVTTAPTVATGAPSAGLRCRSLPRQQPRCASGSHGTRPTSSECPGTRPPDRFGSDQRTKSASRFQVDRISAQFATSLK